MAVFLMVLLAYRVGVPMGELEYIPVPFSQSTQLAGKIGSNTEM